MGGCAHEHDTWQASASGRWTPALETHARDCASCAEVRIVTEALATGSSPAPTTMAPSAIWFCARHIRRVRAMTRIELVSLFGQFAALAVISGALLSFVDWNAVWSIAAAAPAPAWAGLAALVAGAVLVARSWSERSTPRSCGPAGSLGAADPREPRGRVHSYGQDRSRDLHRRRGSLSARAQKLRTKIEPRPNHCPQVVSVALSAS